MCSADQLGSAVQPQACGADRIPLWCWRVCGQLDPLLLCGTNLALALQSGVQIGRSHPDRDLVGCVLVGRLPPGLIEEIPGLGLIGAINHHTVLAMRNAEVLGTHI
jgi:hypothetical protein